MKVFATWLIVLGLMAGGYFAFGQYKKEAPPPAAAKVVAKESVKRAEVVAGTVNVKDITPEMKGTQVEMVGYVHSVSEGKGHVFATFKDVYNDKYIKVVLFAKSIDKLPERKELLLNCQKKNSQVFVSGKVDIYKNELEVIAFKVYTK